MKTHFSLLDAARFFAAFWVMNFHYFLSPEHGEKISWYRYGDLGVQLFFIISGFVIVQSLKGKTLKEFTIGRFIRLFPLFWILCTITYILTVIAPHGNSIFFTGYLRSMTMLGDIFIKVAGPSRLVDPSYWTLAVELIFYIGIGIFVFFFSYKNIRYFFLAWLIISAIAFALHIDENFYIKLLLVRHASYFIFGGALALVATKEAKGLYQKYADWILLFASACYSIYIHRIAIPAYPLENSMDNTIITILLILFFIMVPIFVYTSRYVKNTTAITFLIILGGITYPLYLLHQTIGNLAINYIKNTAGISWNESALAFEALVIVVAYIVYVQDKKMRQWLKDRLLKNG